MSEPTKSSAGIVQDALPTRIWNGGSFEFNHWLPLRDDEALPAEGSVLVSLKRWRRQKSRLHEAPNISFGVRLAPNDEFDPNADDILRLALIALPFPKFTDGRSYSTARRLRELWGYTNELRATGDVLLDQIPLMARCGFTSFEITDQPTIRNLERSGFTRMPRMYQSPARHGDLKRTTGTTPRALVAAE